MKHHAETAPAGKGVPEVLTQCPQCRAWKMENEPYCPCCGAGRGTVCPRCGAGTGHAIAFYCPFCGGKYETGEEDL